MKKPELKMLLGFLVLLVLSACVTNSERPRQNADRVTLIYSGNLDGELEPCGCSEEGDLGGIKRRVQVIDQLRNENPDLFLVSAGGLLISDMPQDRLTSEYILKGFAALDYDAVGVQWRDLAFGKDFLLRGQLPLVVSNWREDVPFKPSRIIKHGDKTLAFFQWLDPASDPGLQMQGEHSPVIVQTDALVKALRSARQQGATTVLASTLTLEQARQQLPMEDIDILLIKSSYEVYGEPLLSGHTLVLQSGSRGMRLGRVDFSVDANGSVSHWQHQVIPLPESVGDAPRMLAWYDAYNAHVKADYERSVSLRKAMATGKSPYAGEQACKDCHAQEHETWEGSQHAQAFYDLQDVNKAFDPNCIGCHTVGFNQDGGFLDADTTPQLMHVQCESCHGAARDHAESAGTRPVVHADWPKQRICGQCHIQKHSPGFSLETYWPKIAHGLKQ